MAKGTLAYGESFCDGPGRDFGARPGRTPCPSRFLRKIFTECLTILPSSLNEIPQLSDREFPAPSTHTSVGRNIHSDSTRPFSEKPRIASSSGSPTLLIIPNPTVIMSWSINQRGLGSQLSANTEGLFHRESERGYHNDYSRIILAAHLEAVRLYASAHAHDPIVASSYGHFSPDGQGEATLKLQTYVPEPELLDQPNEESTS